LHAGHALQFTVLVHQTEDNGVFRRFFNCTHKNNF
jgi:hypothetical protein